MLFRSDRKSTRLNSSHTLISYAVFCLKKKKKAQALGDAGQPRRHQSRAAAHRRPPEGIGVVAPFARPHPLASAHLRPLLFFLNEPAPPEFSPLPLPAPLPT